MKKFIIISLAILGIYTSCNKQNAEQNRQEKEKIIDTLLKKKIDYLVDEALLSDSIQNLEKNKNQICKEIENDFKIILEKNPNSKQNKKITERIRQREKQIKEIEKKIKNLELTQKQKQDEIKKLEKSIKEIYKNNY